LRQNPALSFFFIGPSCDLASTSVPMKVELRAMKLMQNFRINDNI